MTDDPIPLPAWGESEPPDRRRRALVAGGAAAAALLVAVAAFAGVSGASGNGGYRTAVVSTEDVERTLTGVGTIEPVSQAAVAFPVSGTVASVDVSVGSTVVAGQLLASLDTESLATSLHTAEANVAAAELTLQKALNGESTTSSGGGGAGPTTSGSSSSSSASSSASVSGTSTGSTGSTDAAADPALADARQAVADAQHQLDVDLAAAELALSASSTACATTSSSTSTSTSTSSTTVAGGSSTQACQDALAASLASQQDVAASATALQQAVNQLDGLLSSSGGSSTGGSSGSSSGGTSASSSTGGTASSGSSTSSSSSVSSSDLIAAQKAVDAATAELAVAQQSLAQATIVSPIAGTVSAVGFGAGDAVTAGSSTATILVSGPGGYEVTTSVSVTDLPHVAVGQQARVVADGSTTELTATVVQISLVPRSSTTSSSTTYSVVLALTDPDVELPNGGLARTTIVTGEVASATAVPTSAVSTTETGRTVVLLDGGSTTTVSITVGTVGSTWTEITDGLDLGQTVVLADLSEALPGSATSSSSSSTSGSGTPGGFTLPSGGSFTPPSGAGGGARPGG